MVSSAGYSTTPRWDDAASLRSRFTSRLSAQRTHRRCAGVFREWTHPRRAQSASLPADTGIASASFGNHHSCGPSWSAYVFSFARPRRCSSWRTSSGKNSPHRFGGTESLPVQAVGDLRRRACPRLTQVAIRSMSLSKSRSCS